MAEKDKDEHLLYEIDENGERAPVKSLESTASVQLRFTNKTGRPVDVWWRDFNGAKKHFVRLEPDAKYDITTYVTHPWEFTDVANKESYVINNKFIFRPPASIGEIPDRTNFNITLYCDVSANLVS